MMIELNEIRFRWNSEAPVLIDIPSFVLESGETVFLEGPSGCGKTTLLNILSGIVVPEVGSVKINGFEFTTENNATRDSFRADHIGVIFQMFNLIPYLSPLDNVILPCKFSERRHKSSVAKSNSVKKEALRLLKQMKLTTETICNSPTLELSMGQQQRVAAARSLIGAPQLIIADEPTSALDQDSRQNFLKLLFDEVVAAGSTLLLVSHDADLARLFDRKIKFSDINKATKS